MSSGSLTSLDEYLVLLVCLELSLADITSLRQVCRVLYHASRAKVLWINILERGVLKDGNVLPPYLKGYDLDSVALEALVRRVARLTRQWETQDLSPVKNWCLHLPQLITWLRLVNGTWLFVASSDHRSSKISCWDLSLLFQGNAEPLAEAYLPAQVKTGKLEVQDSGIVLALGLGVETSSVHVITLRQHFGRHVFCELCRIEDSSHVLMLCGNFVGCALRRGAIVPHMINWKDSRIYDIPPGLDIPGRRSVPHLMTIWSGFLIILRKNTLEFYTLSLLNNNSIAFVKLLKTPTIWEAVVCNSVSTSLPGVPPLRLIAISPVGIELCVVEHHMLAPLDADPICPSFRQHSEYSPYRLCIGETGRRSLWVSPLEELTDGPCLVYTSVPILPSDTEMPRISWINDQPDQPALWGIPVIDFDDALGLTVIGNCFGELAVYDHDGRYPELCGGLATDFTDQPSAIPPLLPTIPISLGLSAHPMAPSEPDPSIHAYGFPGPVIPQGFVDDSDYDRQHLLFRSGNRYFVSTLETDLTEQQLRSWPLTPPITYFHVPEAQPESYMHQTAILNRMRYRFGRIKRNRWIELADRASQLDARSNSNMVSNSETEH
ncbi:hypothetical protein B0H13DRAFT_2009453 [Mycena leptocephala]|nr:hypothetical protein B0H13DRAFT_2009453 [Mycena leptocephala]